MAYDASLLEKVRSGEAQQPQFRLYRWSEPTISLGCNQKIEKAVDQEAVGVLGYSVVSRPTGGRALLHKGDLCYAIVSRRDWHSEFHSLSATYKVISSAIIECLARIGVVVSQAATPKKRQRMGNDPCFATMSLFEVMIRGRKICGSAQFRTGGSFLQHGSLRVRDNWNENDLITIWPQGITLSDETITAVDRELGLEVDFELVAGHFIEAIKSAFSIDIAGQDTNMS
jgi:lipoate-protein ligase A